VAVTPPPAAVDHLGAVVDSLEVSRANQPGHSTRLAARDRWHVTVVFLGDVAELRLTDVGEALAAAATGTDPFGLRFAGGGLFGRGRRAILWSGLAGDVAALRTLSTAARAALRRARLPYDRKPLRPHLTISRPGARVDADALRRDVATLQEYEGPEWLVDTVELMRSDMDQRPTGPVPRYTPVTTVPLR
jgi:2'-5' RNA ligase